MADDTPGGRPNRAGLLDTLGLAAGVIGPVLFRGLIIRWPRMVGLADRLDVDRRAVRRLQRLRRGYGPGPLLLRIPVRRQAMVLDPGDVHRILDGTPEPFAAASDEKRAALAHFEPEGVLLSTGAERVDRRRFNEDVLDTGQVQHRLADHFTTVVGAEMEAVVAASRRQDGLVTWERFAPQWFRMIRRLVLGDGAADDDELTALLDRLRGDANWAFLHPRRHDVRQRFERRLADHVARAEPGSLAAVMAATPATAATAATGQVPQWLFGSDPAGIATFRALALLATHPPQAARARAELAERGPTSPDLPYLRACVLESLRLWPTTPAVLRQTTAPTSWGGQTLPAGTGLIIFASLFHRDDEHLPEADRFAPELWLSARTDRDWPLIPFSGGPAQCPGRNLSLLWTSSALARLLDGHQVTLERPRMSPSRPLPGTLSPYRLRFRLDP